MDSDIAATFARQFGLVTTAQAHAWGLSDEGIRHKVRSGAWERVGPRLYRLCGVGESWHQSVMGVVLRAGDPSWASHFTSLTLWSYRGFEEREVEVAVPLERRPRVSGARVHRMGTIEDADLRVVDGIPVLSAARTIVDVSSRFDDKALGSLIDDGLRRRVLTLGSLHAVARRLPTIAAGRSPKRMARLLRERIAGYHPGDSELETHVLRALVEAGLPAPVRQWKVQVNGRTYFVDLAYPDAELAIEVDGFDFHRGRTEFDRDRQRQNDLTAAGLTVLRFTSRSTDREIVDTVRPFLFGRFPLPEPRKASKQVR